MCEVSSLVIFPWSRLLNAAYSTDNWGFARLYGVVLKFSPILKGPDVLPQRFPNFGKTNDLVFLTAKLSSYARYLWIKFHWENNTSVRLSLACDGRIFFFHLTLFLLRETNLSSTFTKCLWFVPWVRLNQQQFGKLYLQREILLRLWVLKPVQVAQVSTKTQKIRGKKGSVPP